MNAEPDIGEEIQMREEIVVLEDQGEWAISWRKMGDVIPADPDRAAVRSLEAGDEVKQGGFPRPGRADDRGDDAGLELAVEMELAFAE
jgi:hypothetical protein